MKDAWTILGVFGVGFGAGMFTLVLLEKWITPLIGGQTSIEPAVEQELGKQRTEPGSAKGGDNG